MNRFCSNKFDANYKPSSCDEIMIKKYPFKSRFYEIRMNILNNDPGDNDYSHNDFVILLFDISRPDTLIVAKQFFEQRLKACLHPHENGLSNIIFIGNKTDIGEMSSESIDQIKAYCEENKLNLFLVSAKDNKGIDLTIQTLIEAFDNDVFKFVN